MKFPLERNTRATRPLIALSVLFCTALFSGARAQATLSYATGSVFTALAFNPTVAGSPYPFRTNTPGGGGDASCIINFNPNLNTPGTPEYLRCFKNFPQFFNPTAPSNTPAAPSNGGYNLLVRNCTPSPYRLTIVFSATSPNTRIPIDRIQYTINNGTTWTNASVTAASPTTIPADATIGVCSVADDRLINIRFRLRLQGDEFANPGPITSDVTFRLVTP